MGMRGSWTVRFFIVKVSDRLRIGTLILLQALCTTLYTRAPKWVIA